MERLLGRLLFAASLGCAALAGAVTLPPTQAQELARARRDNGLFVGEGVADAKDFGGDGVKAWLKAREDARGALAMAVQARIRSKVSASVTVAGGQAVETVSAETSSESDVQLRNIGYREYRDTPKPGQVTVLAFITKEDYRRMLAGLQLKAFHPENGVMLGLRYKDIGGLRALLEASQKAQAAAPDLPQYNNKGKATVGPAPAYLLPMAEGHWRDFNAGFGWLHQDVGLYAFDEADSQLHRNSTYTLNGFLYEAGWDLTFWDRRLQAYLPLRLQAAYLELRSESATGTALYPAWLYSATAGLGARFWANEKLAIDGAFLWSLGLNEAQLLGDKGPLRLRPGQDAPPIRMDGLEMKLNFRYSGF